MLEQKQTYTTKD